MNNKGAVHILVFVIVAVIAAVLAFMYFTESTPNVQYTTPSETSEIVATDPVSESDDLDTIETELEETVTSFPEQQLIEIDKDTSSL